MIDVSNPLLVQYRMLCSGEERFESMDEYTNAWPESTEDDLVSAVRQLAAGASLDPAWATHGFAAFVFNRALAMRASDEAVRECADAVIRLVATSDELVHELVGPAMRSLQILEPRKLGLLGYFACRVLAATLAEAGTHAGGVAVLAAKAARRIHAARRGDRPDAYNPRSGELRRGGPASAADARATPRSVRLAERRNRVRLYAAASCCRKAVEALERAMGIPADDERVLRVDAYIEMASCHAQLGRLARARRRLRATMVVAHGLTRPSDRQHALAQIHIARAGVEQLAGDQAAEAEALEHAVTLARKASRDDERSVLLLDSCLLRLGTFQQESSRFEDAIATLTEREGLLPDGPPAGGRTARNADRVALSALRNAYGQIIKEAKTRKEALPPSQRRGSRAAKDENAAIQRLLHLERRQVKAGRLEAAHLLGSETVSTLFALEDLGRGYAWAARETSSPGASDVQAGKS